MLLDLWNNLTAKNQIVFNHFFTESFIVTDSMGRRVSASVLGDGYEQFRVCEGGVGGAP